MRLAGHFLALGVDTPEGVLSFCAVELFGSTFHEDVFMPTDMQKTSNTPTSHLNELLLTAVPYPKPDRPSPCVVMGYQTMSHANLTATDPLDGWKMISAKTCQSVLGARTSTGPLPNLLSYRLMNASQSAPYSRLTARQLLLRFHWILGEGLHLTYRREQDLRVWIPIQNISVRI